MPGIIDLKTNLKDLKFGKDRLGGGDSGQPYITTPIPNNDPLISNLDDGLIRGGTIGAIKHSAIDTIRIFKFFKDAPKGPLFLSKQVGLQLSNPKLETKPIPTISGLGIVGNILNTGINALNNNNIGSTRIYNLGINTLAQIPSNAFGIHFERHGLTPITNENTKYYSVVKNKTTDENRLVQLRKNLILRNEDLKLNKKDSKTLSRILGTIGSNILGLTNVANFISTNLSKQQTIIDQYIGGPGSVYGIGKTTIRRTEFTPAINEQYTKYFDEIRKQNSSNILETNTLLQLKSTLSSKVSGSNNPRNLVPTGLDAIVTPPPQDVIVSKNNYNLEQTVLRGDKKKFFIDNRVNRGNAGDITRDRSDYNKGGALDEITALPIFQASSPNEVKGQNGNDPLRDLIKFRFEAIETDNPTVSNFIVFRAFVKGISFPFNANWNQINYNGRGEPFWVYNGFNNNINFSFTLAAQSRAEMKPMYQKFNYLISNLTPDYKNNRMRGPLIKLTIGNLVYRQPGFITSLSPSIPDNTPWEIALDEPENGADTLMLELPHVIDIQCSFTPIWNFLPQKSLNYSPFIADKGNEGKAGERWIIDTKLKDKTLNKNIKP